MKTPGIDEEKIIFLEDGEIVFSLDEAYEEIGTNIIWYKVKYNNVEGWCNSNKIEKYYE
jgi:hypothetical protein